MSATLAAAVLATTMRLVASHEYAEGAPPGFSGGFKEDSCHACHFHAAPNAAPGRVAVEGVPKTYTAGERYAITVTLTRPSMTRAGFQLSVRFKDTGAQAGTLAQGSSDRDRVSIESQGGVQYANQNKAGSPTTSAGAATWTLEWTAPSGGGLVVFHVSANAADGNGNAEGDFVYTALAETAPR